MNIKQYTLQSGERMRQEFKLVGLSKPKSITCETDQEECFWPSTENLSQDRFNALWKLLDGNWGKVKAIIDFQDINNGMPINPVFIELAFMY